MRSVRFRHSTRDITATLHLAGETSSSALIPFPAPRKDTSMFMFASHCGAAVHQWVGKAGLSRRGRCQTLLQPIQRKDFQFAHAALPILATAPR